LADIEFNLKQAITTQPKKRSAKFSYGCYVATSISRHVCSNSVKAAKKQYKSYDEN
jgi:hypothetical protein